MEIIRFAVRYALDTRGSRKVRFNLSTNGTLLTEDNIRFLIDYDISLAVSLDGPQVIHDRFRVDSNGSGTWETVIRNLRRIRSLDQDYYRRAVLFNVVLTPPYDIVKVNEFFGEHAELFGNANPKITSVDGTETIFLQDFGVTKNYFPGGNQRLMNTYLGIKSASIASPTFLRGYFEDDLLTVHKRPLFNSKTETIFLNGCCTPGQRKIFVSSEGKLHICERISSYMDIGDLENGVDYRRIDNIIEQYITAFKGECCNCWAHRFCKTCFATAKSAGEACVKLKTDECASVRQRTLEIFYLYNAILEECPSAFDGFKQIVAH